MTIQHVFAKIVPMSNGATVWLSLNVINLEDDEFALRCKWNEMHAASMRKLFRRGDDVRCFDCMCWGNNAVSRDFTRVGRLVKEF